LTAQEKFKQLSTAYSILKDPVQRQYYDSHRGMILNNSHHSPYSSYDDDTSGAGFTFDDLTSSPPTPILLQRYLWRCYDQYDDSPTGFYAVYSSLFQHLRSYELDHFHATATSSSSSASGQKEKKKLHGKLLNLASFGNSQSSAEEVLSFYQSWREFSTTLSFEWTDLSSEEIFEYYCTMLDPMSAAAAVGTSATDGIGFNKSHRKHVINEYNHRIQEILDLLEQIDVRFQTSIQEKKSQQKEFKKSNRRKKYLEEEGTGAEKEIGAEKQQAEEEEKKRIEQWALRMLQQYQSLLRYGSVDDMTVTLPGAAVATEATEAAAVNESQLTKTEKEKLKKAQSKVRNVFRKLMKLVLSEYSVVIATSSSMESQVGLSSVQVQSYLNELDSILDRMIAYAPVESLQEINQRIGGEATLKDNSIQSHLRTGISLFCHLNSLTTQYEQQTSLFLTREKMIHKLSSAITSIATTSSTHLNRWRDCDWSQRERLIIRSVYHSFVNPSFETNTNATTSAPGTVTVDLFFIPNKQLPLRSFWKYLTITTNYFLWISPSTADTECFDASFVNSIPVSPIAVTDLTQVAGEAYLFSEEEIMRALFYLVTSA
jgi:curved DNA-binding protein CbpA